MHHDLFLVAGISIASHIFYLTFFVIITSVLLQGWTVPILARKLGIASRTYALPRLPLEFASSDNKETELVDFIVPYHSAIIGQPIVELAFPKDGLIVLISRNNDFFVPSGGTILEEGDTLLVLVTKQNVGEVCRILSLRAPF
jgi:cell volume regulation protein A